MSTTTQTPTVTVRLPRRFYDDHVDRELSAGVEQRRLARQVEVVLDQASFDELRSDADHYATSPGFDPSLRGLIASARATVAALDVAGRPSIQTITTDELVALVDDEILDQAKAAFARWAARGDGVAVYENHDLGHPGLGHRQFLSYGSDEAQLVGVPPVNLPDIGSSINWRYILTAVCPAGS